MSKVCNNGQRKAVMALGVASDHYSLPLAIITDLDLGYLTGPL